MFKVKIDSIHYLAVLSILGWVLWASEGRAQTTASDTGTAASTETSTTTPSGDNDANYGQKRDFHKNDRRRQNLRIFYLGVCSGQVLAKQGTYLSDVASGSTTTNESDLKTAIKAAIQTCKAEAKANGGSATASPTPVPSATPTSTTSPTSVTTTTASES